MVAFSKHQPLDATVRADYRPVWGHDPHYHALRFRLRANSQSLARIALPVSCKTNPALRDVISRYIELLWAEAQQIAACNAGHDASERLCRWLLQCADRIGSDTVALTQDYLAQMLGVRRTTVTLLAKSLQDQGIIKYRRGCIHILDRERLKHGACECYHVMQTGRLMPSSSVKPILTAED